MKRTTILALSVMCATVARGATIHVSTNSASNGPGTSWANAFHVIQDGVDAASAGDTVLVTNGVYDTGGAVTPGYSLQNRVCVTKNVTVESVNGPDHTFIVGAEASGGGNGSNAVRGVYMSVGTLAGFTVTNGHTMVSGDYGFDLSGGGVNMYGGSGLASNCVFSGNSACFGGGSHDGTLTDCTLAGNLAEFSGGGSLEGTLTGCTLSGNSADQHGGGSRDSTLNNCTLFGNSAIYGGGSEDGTLNNCTLFGNSAGYDGGGSYEGRLRNCIVYGNSATRDGDNWYDERRDLAYCCTTPDPGGIGNTTYAPLFADAANGDFHLKSTAGRWDPAAGAWTKDSVPSPCIDAGDPASGYGNEPPPGGGRVNMGAYGNTEQASKSPPEVDITAPADYTNVYGEVTACAVSGTAGNDVVGWMGWTNAANGAFGTFSAGVGWSVPDVPLAFGDNVIAVWGTNAVGVLGRGVVTIRRTGEHGGDSPVHFVSTQGAAVWPYTNWTTAAQTIQDAVDAASDNDRVTVSNGVYATGGAVTPGYTSMNRLVIERDILVQSVNGSSNTFIVGAAATGGGNGSNAVRGVYMSAGTLCGFTVTNGHSMTSRNYVFDRSGGGVNMYGGGGQVSNCVLSGNSAHMGGGSCYGTLTGCTFLGNQANCGGGSYYGTLTGCTLSGNSTVGDGGGSYYGTLTDCTLCGNSAEWGGGSYDCALTGCTLFDNSARRYGGGSGDGTLNNCTLFNNTAEDGGGSSYATLTSCTLFGNRADFDGGGSYSCTLRNCIVYYNDARGDGDNWARGSLSYCCTTHAPGGTGNIGNAPMFADAAQGDFHLKSVTGRWDPAARAWTNDAVTSPCIDAGDPGLAHENEPVPNGGRVNMGAYANTGEASKTPPLVFIVTPAGDTNVYGEVTAYTVAGTANDAVVGRMAWTNSATGEGDTFPAEAAWSVSVPLAFGDNVIAVTGTNELGVAAGGSVAVLRLVEHGPNSPVHYVRAGSLSPLYPYTNWTTAACTIQDAVDAACDNDTVLVSNGVYDAGGAVTPGYACANRVVIEKDILVRSANGPGTTFIEGAEAAGGGNGSNAVRGVYMSAGVLWGFTVTNGHTMISGDSDSDCSGGGINMCGGSGLASNCVLSGNCAGHFGGGSFAGALAGCALCGNSAGSGGGSRGGALTNCTLFRNSADLHGGGSYGGILRNCIVYHNNARAQGNNWYEGSLAYCCTTPAPGGTGNVTADPLLLSASHICTDSPCVGAGSSDSAVGTDIDGDGWASPSAIGCDEPRAPFVGDLSVDIVAGDTNLMVVVGHELGFWAKIAGEPASNRWTFGDGDSLLNGVHAQHAWSGAGKHAVVLTAWNDDHPGGVSATVLVKVVTGSDHYVNRSNTSPVPPYALWEDAATNIQDAVNAAGKTVGATVWVTNGVYDTGGAVTPGYACANRVVIEKDILVRSVNGPRTTFIAGAEATGGGNGSNAVRGVYMSAGVLYGFTVTNGHTMTSGDTDFDRSGGGINMCGGSGLASNCVLAGNSADARGGGGSYGTLTGCTLSGNSSGADGGGSGFCTLTGCTLSGNLAQGHGGGSYDGTLKNCIVYHNTAGIQGDNWSGGTLSYCCTIPDPGGTGNITNAPLFAGPASGDFHLKSVAGRWDPAALAWTNDAVTSPCVDAGDPVSAYDNEPAPRGGRVNMGVHGNTGEASKSRPGVVVTSPVGDTNVYGEVAVYTVTGTANDAVVGWMVWTNPATGEGRAFPAETVWSVSVPLAFGDNPIAVHGTNELGTADSDSVTIVRAVEHGPGSPVHYVRDDSLSPLYPFTNWTTAAHTIQDAVNAASENDTILVTNGVYSTGGAVAQGGVLSNRVLLASEIRVVSVNGPSNTFIVGAADPATGNGDAAVRCVSMSAAAHVAGFTLMNGHTMDDLAAGASNVCAGGVFFDAPGTLSNCVIRDCSAVLGGGAFLFAGGLITHSELRGNVSSNAGGVIVYPGGVIEHSTIVSNRGPWGGGVYFNRGGVLNQCIVEGNYSPNNGGGIYHRRAGVVSNCVVRHNRAATSGGGVYTDEGGRIVNTLIARNYADSYAGGIYCGETTTVVNCTIAGNSALDFAGGCYAAQSNELVNSIFYFNTAPDIPNCNTSEVSTCYRHVCTTPGVPGIGNITGDPQFVDEGGDDYRLGQGSPCIDAGSDADVQGDIDLEGNPRLVRTVDMGAYENGLALVATYAPTRATPDSVQCGGNVTHEGNGSVTARGCVWNTTGSPTPADALTADGSGGGAFTCSLTGLLSRTTYHVCAYATNAYGMAYGEERIFTTTGMTPPGNALEFDGTNDHAVVPHENIGNPVGSFTVECWARLTANGSGDASFISKHQDDGGSARSGYVLEYSHDYSRLTVNFGHSGGWTHVHGGSWTLGPWHHVAFVYDAGAGTLELFDNGVLQDTATQANPRFNTRDLWLGGSSWYGNYFGGTVDEVRIWGVARTETEIRANMYRELAGDEPGLVAYYPLNQQSTTELDDVTTNSHDGTLVNGPAWVPSTVPWLYVLTASAGAHGTIDPVGAVEVMTGGSTNFAITSDTYWHVGDVTTNGASVGAVTAYTWTNVTADGTIHAMFDPDLAAGGTPHWWLAEHGLTNGGLTFDQAENGNPDGDAHLTWQEYIADTDPTDSNDYFRVTGVSVSSPAVLSFESSSNCLYSLQGRDGLVTGDWAFVSGKRGVGGADSLADTNDTAKGSFYRLEVARP